MNIKLIKYAFTLLIVAGGLVTVLAFLGQFHWRLDLISHFRLQYLTYFFFLLIFAVILKSKIFIGITLIFFIINLLPFLPLYFPLKSPVKESGVTILAANVSRENREFSKAVELIQKTKPDIVILEEVDEGWLRAFDDLKKTYPYAVSEPREDYFGIAMLSKYELLNPRIEKIGKAGVPTVVANVKINSKEITVIGIHPIPPFSKRNTELRNEQIEQLAHYVNKQNTPVLVIGDLNATPFSYPYTKFIQDTKLVNCSNGFGYHPTWHLKPFVPPLGLVIDHCFYQQPIKVLDSYVEEDIGSDHKPIVNRISI